MINIKKFKYNDTLGLRFIELLQKYISDNKILLCDGNFNKYNKIIK